MFILPDSGSQQSVSIHFILIHSGYAADNQKKLTACFQVLSTLQRAVVLRFTTVLHVWDNPKLRHFHWLLNRPTAAMTNENDVIEDCPTKTILNRSATAPWTHLLFSPCCPRPCTHLLSPVLPTSLNPPPVPRAAHVPGPTSCPPCCPRP